MKRDSNVIEKRNYSTYLAVLAWNVVYGLFVCYFHKKIRKKFWCELHIFRVPFVDWILETQIPLLSIRLRTRLFRNLLGNIISTLFVSRANLRLKCWKFWICKIFKERQKNEILDYNEIPIWVQQKRRLLPRTKFDGSSRSRVVLVSAYGDA